MSKTIRVVAHIVALSEKVEEVKAILMRLVEPTRQENGCIQYQLLQNQADSTDFTFIEEWETADALDTHLATTHIATASAQLDGLIATEPDIRCYQLLA